jgi:hypothetical protein
VLIMHDQATDSDSVSRGSNPRPPANASNPSAARVSALSPGPGDSGGDSDLDKVLDNAATPRSRWPIDLRRLRADILYDPETGKFTRKRFMRGRRGGVPAGAPCDFPTTWGYRKVVYRQVRYPAHRLAWYYVHGYWPPDAIDHINRDPADNRLANLRLADACQNSANSRARRNSKSGVPGVRWVESKWHWRAMIQWRRKRYELGCFESREEAVAARRAAEASFYGEFAPTLSPERGRLVR